MRVRIVKAPQALVLEGWDLRSLKLRPEETRNLKSPIANVLVAWGYAEKLQSRARPTKKRRAGRRK